MKTTSSSRKKPLKKSDSFNAGKKLLGLQNKRDKANNNRHQDEEDQPFPCHETIFSSGQDGELENNPLLVASKRYGEVVYEMPIIRFGEMNTSELCSVRDLLELETTTSSISDNEEEKDRMDYIETSERETHPQTIQYSLFEIDRSDKQATKQFMQQISRETMMESTCVNQIGDTWMSKEQRNAILTGKRRSYKRSLLDNIKNISVSLSDDQGSAFDYFNSFDKQQRIDTFGEKQCFYWFLHDFSKCMADVLHKCHSDHKQHHRPHPYYDLYDEYHRLYMIGAKDLIHTVEYLNERGTDEMTRFEKNLQESYLEGSAKCNSNRISKEHFIQMAKQNDQGVLFDSLADFFSSLMISDKIHMEKFGDQQNRTFLRCRIIDGEVHRIDLDMELSVFQSSSQSFYPYLLLMQIRNAIFDKAAWYTIGVTQEQQMEFIAWLESEKHPDLCPTTSPPTQPFTGVFEQPNNKPSSTESRQLKQERPIDDYKWFASRLNRSHRYGKEWIQYVWKLFKHIQALKTRANSVEWTSTEFIRLFSNKLFHCYMGEKHPV